MVKIYLSYNNFTLLVLSYQYYTLVYFKFYDTMLFFFFFKVDTGLYAYRDVYQQYVLHRGMTHVLHRGDDHQ